jgi:hypothetical protein
MMNVIMSTLEAAPSDSERMHLLNTLPAPQGIRVIMGLSTLSPEVDAFKMLKPIAKKMDAMQRKFFITFSKMSDAEVEKEIKEDSDGDSESSDSSSDDVDPASLSPTESKLKAVLAALEQEDLKVMFLARPYDQAKAKPKDITVAKVLAVEHLMLPAPTVDVAQRLAKRASKMVFGWPGGATSCGNAVWGRFLRPALAEAQAAIARRDSAAALGPLLGVVLIGCSDDGWLRDQEEYCEWDAFAQWFADVSKAWQKVLAEPDGALGLAPARGRKELGHYRGVLMRVLTKWEEEVNETLDEVFDEFKEGGKKAKLSATEKPKAKPPLKGKGKAAVAPSSASSSGKRRRGQ